MKFRAPKTKSLSSSEVLSQQNSRNFHNWHNLQIFNLLFGGRTEATRFLNMNKLQNV